MAAKKEVALAVLDSAFSRKGYTFSVEISRQGGKNELSAQLELLLLTLFIAEPKNIINAPLILNRRCLFL